MIYFDEDSDARYFQVEAGTMTHKHLDNILANLSKTSIEVYIVGINAQFACFRNHAIESYLDDFDIRLGMNQPALRGNQEAWAYRRRANMAVLDAQGIDSNAYLIEGTRKLGKAAWIDIRMNDMHDGHDENSQLHTNFWRNHPELRIPGNIPCENGFDYSHARVRSMFTDFIVEAFEKYHPDNILLDWMRWPTFFPRGTGRKRAHLITEMLKDIRSRIGRPLACRVPITQKSAEQLGLDVSAWVKEGILSHLFLGNFSLASTYDVPVEQWRQTVGRIPIIVTLDNSWMEGLDIPHESNHFSVEEARGIAAAAYWRGADGIQLFNVMIMLGELPPEQRKGMYLHSDTNFEAVKWGQVVLNELQDPRKLYSLPRRVRPGWNDSEIPLGDLDQIFRVPGYLEKWRKTHSAPEGTLPQTKPTTWKLWTAKAPDHDVRLVTDAAGRILVNGHEVFGTSPIRIPAEYLRNGVTEIQTESFVSKLYMELQG